MPNIAYIKPSYLSDESIGKSFQNTGLLHDVISGNNPYETTIEIYDVLYKNKINYKREDYRFFIEGKVFKLSNELSYIAEAIIKSKRILNLANDWDDEGALATDLATYLKAVGFIVNYSQHIFDHSKIRLDVPDIDVLKDGAVIVNWETAGSTFVIIFEKEEKDIYYYYALAADNPIPLRYGINITNPIDKFTASWMTDNLKRKL